MNLPKRTTSQQNFQQSNQSPSSHSSDWTSSSSLSQTDEARMEYTLVTKVLFGPIYSDVVGKLLDTGKPSEIETLRVSFENVLWKLKEKNTELASYSTQPFPPKNEFKPMSKYEIAREAGKISLKRFLNSDSLKKLEDTPLEKWGTSEIRYARTLISFLVAAKYGEIGAFQASDQEFLLEMLIKLFKHPKVNKYQEFLNEVERQKTIMESELRKKVKNSQELPKLPKIPTVQELIESTKKSVARRIWDFFMTDRPIIKTRPVVKKQPKMTPNKDIICTNPPGCVGNSLS